jgi:hypothetical protein
LPKLRHVSKVLYRSNFIIPEGAKVLEFGTHALFSLPGNVVCIHIRSTFEGDVAAVKNMLEHILTVNEGRPVKILAVYEDGCRFENEVGAFMNSDEVNAIAMADALVYSGMPTRLIINVFVRVWPPKRPVRAFGNIREAKEWLDSL